MTYPPPNRDDIKIFMHVLFSSCSGYIPCRSFAEKGGYSAKPYNIWFKADDAMVDNCNKFADQVLKRKMGCFVIPGTVNKPGQAGSSDIAEMQALLIDIDEGDTEQKLNILTKALGQPTLIVESGGITKEGNIKLHVYWQLVRAVSDEDLRTLLNLRHLIAKSVGGDIHFKSAHQPIRVAGSVYHKGDACKSVKIRSYEPVEYELEELVNACGNLPSLAAPGDLPGLVTPFIQANNSSIPIDQIMTSKVHAGGNSEFSRFNNLQRIIGFWLRRYHEGNVTGEQAWQEINDYNAANVIPPWSEDRLRQMAGGLWKKHISENGKVEEKNTISINSYSLDEYLQDISKLPEDIIAPRILTPGGLFVFGGAPKVGKSDFLLNLFTHMAAGKEFLGFKPPRPLKIFYFQAEIGYHYLRERLQNMQLPKELLNIAKHNLQITPNSKLFLNEPTIKKLAEHILEKFPEGIDIIAVDPIRNVFDGGRENATENENDAMLFFLQQRIEVLRDAVNPNAGIVLVHHTKKLSQKQFDEEPFAAFSGASSLRSYYSSGAILRKSEINEEELELLFELRNGAAIETKLLTKDNGWKEINTGTQRIAFKKQGSLFDQERERRVRVIIRILEEKAIKGKFYLMKQFAEKFRNNDDLGNIRAIKDDCSAAATQGLIKFFDNPAHYGLDLKNDGKASFGFMCTKEMKMYVGRAVNPDTGEIAENYKKVLPTHYKRDGDGKKEDMLNPEIWEINEEKEN